MVHHQKKILLIGINNMKQLEEFVNEKLKISKNNVTPDIPLGEQGWMCTYVYSIYNEIQKC